MRGRVWSEHINPVDNFSPFGQQSVTFGVATAYLSNRHNVTTDSKVGKDILLHQSEKKRVLYIQVDIVRVLEMYVCTFSTNFVLVTVP